MEFDITKNANAIAKHLQDTIGRVTGDEGLRAAALVFDGTIKKLLNTPGRGKIRTKNVKRGKKSTSISRAGRASAPGDPPAPDRGLYRRSWGFGFIRPGLIRMGTPDVRGPALEFGTRNGRIKPRPHARPAYTSARSGMIEATERAMIIEVRSKIGG